MVRTSGFRVLTFVSQESFIVNLEIQVVTFRLQHSMHAIGVQAQCGTNVVWARSWSQSRQIALHVLIIMRCNVTNDFFVVKYFIEILIRTFVSHLKN